MATILRKNQSNPIHVLLIAGLLLASSMAYSQDWPMWGGTPSRNMSSSSKAIVDGFEAGEFIEGSEDVDLAATRNVKWAAKLGSQSYGNPTVSRGRVFVGTNNESPRDPKHIGDRGTVYCLDEQTGEFIWQLVVPKLGAGKVSDWEYLGTCSSPSVDGDRVYVVTNRCEVVCLDFEGMANGNDGPFTDEGQYMAGPGKPPVEVGPTDADIIWRFDMRDELGIFPHNIASSSVLIAGDRVFVTTSNGQDWSHVNIPNPLAPCLISLDKRTGELIGEEGSSISERLHHCNWSSPAYGEIDGAGIVLFGAGDGYCYGFGLEGVEDDEGFSILPELWRYDCNPPLYRQRDGKPIQYPDYDGPSEVIATPVFHNGRVYVSIGQDPEHGDGVGVLQCIDAGQSGGDVTSTAKVWSYDGISRSISTVSIVNGLVFVSDYRGRVHCLDADTGQVYWVHDTGSHIWGSTLAADGKVFIGNEDGVVLILAAEKEKRVIREIEMGAPVYATPIAANGVLYIASQTHLYAIAKTGS